MKEKILIGNFIDKLKALDVLEIVIFFHAWEETAPIFFSENYRLTLLTENFVLHLLDEINCYEYFVLKELKGKPRLTKLALLRMNSVLKQVNAIAENYVETEEYPQIAERG